MITNSLIQLFYLLILAITSPLRLFPDATLPANLTSAIATASTYLTAINFVFPVATFITIFTIILSIETFIILYKIINWVIRKIPTIS